jgi:aminopeptidase N
MTLAATLTVSACSLADNSGGAADRSHASRSGPQPSAAAPNRLSPSVAPTPQLSRADLLAARSHPVEDPYYPQTSNPEVDAIHYSLALTWTGTTLTGTTTLDFRATRATNVVHLDLSHALHVSNVVADGTRVDSLHPGDLLVIDGGDLKRGSLHRLQITYAGRPTPTPAPSHRGDMTGGLGWTVAPDHTVYTFQEPYGAFTWYPVNDHPSDKALYDATITTPAGTQAVFNGLPVGRPRDQGGTVTTRWHLDEPAASYLITIAIGPYRHYSDTMSDGTPVTYWLLPGDWRLLPRLRLQCHSAYDWLIRHAGPYPFHSLGIVVVGGRSGMETQTMITLSRGAVMRPDAVVEHEIAHQWYGDEVTPIDWRGLWLNEGWAMYMQHAYEVDTSGFAYGDSVARWRVIDRLSVARAGPAGSYDPLWFADVNVYLGPALMLMQLRHRIGPAEFTRLAQAWPRAHRYGNADRADFEAFVRQRTGHSFHRLFHRWLD